MPAYPDDRSAEIATALEILGIVDVRPGSGTHLRGTASELLPQSLR